MKWMGAAAAFVGLQLCVAAMLALSIGFYAPPPFVKYALTALIPVLLYGAGFALWNLRNGPDEPFKHLASLDWTPFRNFVSAMGLVWLQFVALTWMKAMLAVSGPMWADPVLAEAEAALFGADVWRLLPAPWRPLEVLYLLWPLAVCASFTALFFMRRQTSLLAFFLTVGILGTFGQYLLPSGGPVFYERLGYGDRFAAMEIPGRTTYLTSMLWQAYQGHAINFATGISAFPSIHVATSAWIAISFRRWWAYAYLALIFFGSIILGWHYALDGIAGAIGAVLCYALARKVLTYVPVRTRETVGA